MHCWDVLAGKINSEAVAKPVRVPGDRIGLEYHSLFSFLKRAQWRKNNSLVLILWIIFWFSYVTRRALNFCFPNNKPLRLRFGCDHLAPRAETTICTLHH